MPDILSRNDARAQREFENRIALAGQQERSDANASNMAFKAAEAERRAQEMALREQVASQKYDLASERNQIQAERLQWQQEKADKIERDSVAMHKEIMEAWPKMKNLDPRNLDDVVSYFDVYGEMSPQARKYLAESDEITNGFAKARASFGEEEFTKRKESRAVAMQTEGEQRRAALSQQGKSIDRAAKTADELATERRNSQVTIAGLNSLLKEKPDDGDAPKWRAQLVQEEERIKLLEAEKTGVAPVTNADSPSASPTLTPSAPKVKPADTVSKPVLNGQIAVPNSVLQVGSVSLGTPSTPERTATNPTTGEKVVFRNGAWIPLK